MSDIIMKMNENKEQYVYVMSNPSFPEDMLKIGWTREHPNIRANDLHTSGVPTPFIVEFVIITLEGSKVEKIIHNYIKTYRVNSNREFFKISKEELTRILVNDLMFELTSITEISAPINIKKNNNKKVNEIKILYEQVKKEADDFFGEFKKEKSKLVIKEINNKKYVYISAVEYNQTPLHIHGFEDDDEGHIKNAYYFINRDIIQYKEWLDDLIDNYEEIKNRIGVEKLRSDNKSFKEMILDTRNDLLNLKSKYIWEI
jgi:hypothetical protein